MPSEEAGIKLLSIQEATALLPIVRQALGFLRELRGKILKTQAQIEIEELTGTDSKGRLSASAQMTLSELMETL